MQVIRYVDPDASGANNGTSWIDAYTSLATWNTNEATNLVSDGDFHIVYCRSSGGTADVNVNISAASWTTDATHYIEVIGTDFPSDGIWDDTKYRVSSSTGYVAAITISTKYVKLRNLQLRGQMSANSGIYALDLACTDTDNRVTIDSCILKGVCSGSCVRGWGIRATEKSAFTAYNSIIYGWYNGSGTDFNGFRHSTTGNCYMYNCTILKNWRGIHCVTSDDLLGLYNTIVGISYSGVDIYRFEPRKITITHCCTDDNEGLYAQTPLDGDWDNELQDITNDDFRIKLGGNCISNGMTNPSNGLYIDDVVGVQRE